MTTEKLIRDVVGYEGLYSIDIFGNVFRKSDNAELSQHLTGRGYPTVMLNNGGKQKPHKVHRLIADAFIPNPQGKKQVNHIDGDKMHNVVWNLEWVTPHENSVHAGNVGLFKISQKVMLVETGEVFNSLGSCARKINGNVGDISRCLNSRGTKTHKGYHFERVV